MIVRTVREKFTAVRQIKSYSAESPRFCMDNFSISFPSTFLSLPPLGKMLNFQKAVRETLSRPATVPIPTSVPMATMSTLVSYSPDVDPNHGSVAQAAIKNSMERTIPHQVPIEGNVSLRNEAPPQEVMQGNTQQEVMQGNTPQEVIQGNLYLRPPQEGTEGNSTTKEEVTGGPHILTQEVAGGPHTLTQEVTGGPHTLTREVTGPHTLTQEVTGDPHTLTQEVTGGPHTLTQEVTGGPHTLTQEVIGGPHTLTQEVTGGPHTLTQEVTGGPHTLTQEVIGGPHTLTQEVTGGLHYTQVYVCPETPACTETLPNTREGIR